MPEVVVLSTRDGDRTRSKTGGPSKDQFPAHARPAIRSGRGASQKARETLLTQTIVEELVVKSRHRVKTYGEVFTPRRMVDRMLDLVHEELEAGPGFVDKTFLEPAAGDGNFLVAILHRKLAAIKKRYPPADWPYESLFALASIYGIELLGDNHADAKAAMLNEFLSFHTPHQVPCGPRTRLRRAAAFLIDTNVLQGDTLTGLKPDGEEIEFSWWNRVSDRPGIVQRIPFRLASLREDNLLDLRTYDTYAVCRIDHVHEQARTRG